MPNSVFLISSLSLLSACGDVPSAPSGHAPDVPVAPNADEARDVHEELPAPWDLSAPPEASEPPEEGIPEDGRFELHWPDGTIALSGNMRHGRRHGRFIFHGVDGSVFETGAYRNGEPVGVWVTAHTDGAERRTTIAPGYCTDDSVLTGAPRDATRMCADGSRTGADDARHDEDAAELRRCLDHRREWLSGHLRSADPGNAALARQLVARSASVETWSVLRDAMNALLDATEAGDTTYLAHLLQSHNALGTRDMPFARRLIRVAGASDDPMTLTNLSIPARHLASASEELARAFVASEAKATRRNPRHGYHLREAAKALDHRLEPDDRVGLWLAITAELEGSRGTSAPDNIEGHARLALSRACADAGYPECARTEHQRAVAIFEGMSCVACLEVARGERDPF